MQLWIGVHLPRLALESFRPVWSTSQPHSPLTTKLTTELANEFATEPGIAAAAGLATGLVVLEKDRVIALDDAAREMGVTPGMRRGGVMTLAPHAQIQERDVAREDELLRGTAFALMQFSPSVVLDDATVLVDVSASLRLFGGMRALRRRVRSTVAALGVTAAIALAPTALGAWLLAGAAMPGRRRTALSTRSLLRTFRHVPLLALPAARRYAEWFDGLGCETLEDLGRLPRAGLKRRCGTALLDALDRATGAAPEVHVWLVPPPSFDARIELPDRIEHAEAVLFSARRLILQMTGWLSAKQLAVARLALHLEHERGRAALPPTELDMALAEPTSSEEHLMRLLKERLGQIKLVAAVIAVRLEAKDVQQATMPSEELFPEPGGSPQDHARLMELLVARVGAENVLVAAPAADHRPEMAARWVPIADRTKYPPVALPADRPRPAWLADPPVQLLMRNHRPFYGTPLKMVSPGERIETGWEDDQLVTRDYFVAESDDHVFYWVYRERVSSRDEQDPRWFLHGLFG